MLGKLILLALVVWLVLVLLKKYRRSLDDAQRPLPKPEDMVSCSVCGVHLPKSESVLQGGAYYCCKEHSEHGAR